MSQHVVASGTSQLEAFFARIEGLLTGVAVGALTVAIIIIGFKIMFAIRSGDNVRMAIQNMGVVAFAALLIGGASGIAALLNAIGRQIGG
ncbi:TrbC/VirB2 family protein [Thermasporomyces composti]|jgi:hypothetical protein|uniref:TrbC/VIRB2 family protein n=1 Tax=Thermasporomyces composti TaxID=696763 RepID=A0A3D9VEH6_THECX|nr:TrbC/VirB2 family protein [Thermasporomyces composti]REF36544.1 TrbC/VIRB2 family protein [Thermasporomyces composti]